jgi:predicted RNase H-like HicB family nuclease
MAERRSKNTEQEEVPGRLMKEKCQPCLNKDRRTVADKFCTTCKEFQCTECSIAHNTYAFMKNHELVNANDVKAKQTMFDMKGLDQCDQHHETLKFLCEDENKLCCSTCAIVDHRKCHSVVEVEKIAKKLPSTGSSLQKTLQEIKENAEFVVNKVISSKEQLKQDAEKISMTIRRMRDEVVELFNALEVSVMKKVKSFKADKLAELDRKQSKNEAYIAIATQSLESINKAHVNGTLTQQFIVEKKMEKHVNTLYNKVHEECQNIKIVVISFAFDKTLKLPPLPISDYVPGRLILKSQLSDSMSDVS